MAAVVAVNPGVSAAIARDMSWVLGAALLATVVLGLVLRRRTSRLHQLAAMIPGPTPLPLLGNAAIFAGSKEEIMPKLSGVLKQYGDVVKLWLGPELNVMVADPDDLKLLLSSPKNSVKGPSYKFMEELIGVGILSGSGHTWRRHRKLASPNMGKRAVESYGGVFIRESSLLVERLRQETGRELDVYDQIVRSTTYVVCQTVFGLSKEETMNLPHLHVLIYMSGRFYSEIYARMTSWWLQSDLIYRFTEGYAFNKKFHNMFWELCGVIVEHRNKAVAGVDLSRVNLNADENSVNNAELGAIDRFILSKELHSKELIEETITLFTASQEATAKIASFMLLMLACHPKYQERLYSEIVSVLGEDGPEGAPLTPANLLRMKYLDCVFKENVRLFPIGAVIQRTITEEFKISRDYGTKLVKQLVVDVVRKFRLTSNQTYKDLRLKVAISIASVDGYKVILEPRT